MGGVESICWEEACTVPVDETQLYPLLKEATRLGMSYLGVWWKADWLGTSEHRVQDSTCLTSAQVRLLVHGPYFEQHCPRGEPGQWWAEGKSLERPSTAGQGTGERGSGSALTSWVSSPSSVNTRRTSLSLSCLSSFKNLGQEGRLITWRATPSRSGVKEKTRAWGNERSSSSWDFYETRLEELTCLFNLIPLSLLECLDKNTKWCVHKAIYWETMDKAGNNPNVHQ